MHYFLNVSIDVKMKSSKVKMKLSFFYAVLLWTTTSGTDVVGLCGGMKLELGI